MRKTIASHVPVLVIAADGTISYANHAAHRLLCYSAGSLHGRPLNQLSPPERWVELRAVHAVFDGARGRRILSKALRADGRVVDVALTVEPSVDDRRNVVAAVVSCNPLPPWKAAS